MAGVISQGAGGQPGAASRARPELTQRRRQAGPRVPAGGPYPGPGRAGRAQPGAPGRAPAGASGHCGLSGGRAAAMGSSLGARSESAGPRAASGRFWAVVLGAAAGFFLLGFLIGTVHTNPPSHRGLGRPGTWLGAGPRQGRGGGRSGRVSSGREFVPRVPEVSPCSAGRYRPPCFPPAHRVQSLTLSEIPSSPAGEGFSCLCLVFLLTFC